MPCGRRSISRLVRIRLAEGTGLVEQEDYSGSRPLRTVTLKLRYVKLIISLFLKDLKREFEGVYSYEI